MCLNSKLFEIPLHEGSALYPKGFNGSKDDHRTHIHDSIAFELHRYLKQPAYDQPGMNPIRLKIWLKTS
jgi:hypothetical protein